MAWRPFLGPVRSHALGVSERRGTATTYLPSGPKNTDAQTSALGTLTTTRQYDAFGNVASSTGTRSGDVGGFGYREDRTGLRQLGLRLYDASTDQFLTRDPIKDGRNWYVVCGNDPINGVDPTGLFVRKAFAVSAFLYGPYEPAKAADDQIRAAMEASGKRLDQKLNETTSHVGTLIPQMDLHRISHGERPADSYVWGPINDVRDGLKELREVGAKV